MTVRVDVDGVPDWVPAEQLLGDHPWRRDGDLWTADLSVRDAADVDARLRGVGLGGRKLAVTATPPLPRAAVRAARTEDARRRRETTPGFLRTGTRADDEGRMSLTPEALAVDLGQAAKDAGFARVIDAGCGVGGNSIGFARAGLGVVAIERDEARLEMARHNAGIYGVVAKIRFVHGDAVALAPGRVPDGTLVFCDPPWGAEWNRERTVAGDFPLLTSLLERVRGPLWAKLPPSFDPSSVDGGIAEAWFGRAEGDRRRIKFVLLRTG